MHPPSVSYHNGATKINTICIAVLWTNKLRQELGSFPGAEFSLNILMHNLLAIGMIPGLKIVNSRLV